MISGVSFFEICGILLNRILLHLMFFLSCLFDFFLLLSHGC